MRFEVNVDDGNNLNTLHKARELHNTANPSAAAPDMPTFVQRLMDQAVACAMQPIAPTSLSEALTRIADLEAKNSLLEQDAKAQSQQ